MQNKGRFHFGGTNAVTRNIDDVIDAARDPVETVFIAEHRIARKVITWIWFQIGRHEAFVILQTRTSHTRPRLTNGQDAYHLLSRLGLDDGAINGIQNYRFNTIRRQRARARLHGSDTGNVGDNVAARLGLPVRVDDGALLSTDIIEIPTPGFGVDGFSHRAQNLETAQIVFLRNIIVVTHQQTDGCGRRVELRNLVALNHIPISTFVGIYRRRLKKEGGRAIQQRTINDICVASNPPTIGDASKDVAFRQIKGVFGSEGGVERVPTRCVHKTLG
mmetsp:Transcript_420/g.910  ORF Transcript_420/g.910 Transcript_420/m.910 type:complete len:275 (+) Transcript_420:399-1223(+)